MSLIIIIKEITRIIAPSQQYSILFYWWKHYKELFSFLHKNCKCDRFIKNEKVFNIFTDRKNPLQLKTNVKT